MVKKPFSRAIAILTGKGDPEGGDPLTIEASLSKVERFAHFCVLLGKSFVRNRCPVRAAALSYTTLLALIPMLAIAVSVASGVLKKQGENAIYGFIDKATATLMPPGPMSTNTAGEPMQVSRLGDIQSLGTNMPGQSLPELTNMLLSVGGTNTLADTNTMVVVATDKRVVTAQKEAARYIHDFIQNTSPGTLGVTGMVILIIVVIRMFSNIEGTFNDIWGVVRGRGLFQSISQYSFVIMMGPILLTTAVALSSGPQFQSTRLFLQQMPLIGGLVFKLLPLMVLWITFAFIYQVVPNTRVHFGAALVGGVVAGTLWHLNNLFGFLFVSRVMTNSKIYGSIGLIPVLMLGLYFSWIILLFGAQVAYAYQNRRAYLQEKLVENVNQRGREFIALRLMTCIGQRFQQGQHPATIPEMSKELGVPSKLIQQVLRTLLAARLVVEVAKLEPAYAPARPLDAINAHHVLMAMRATIGQELHTRDEPVRAEVYGEFARIEAAEKQAASSITLLELVTRAKARLELQPPPADTAPLKTVPALTPPREAVEPKPVPVTPVFTAPLEVAVEDQPVPAPPAKSVSTPEVVVAQATAKAGNDEDNSFPL